MAFPSIIHVATYKIGIMNFNGFIDINRPLEKVVDAFMNAEKKWQEGFVKKELLSGEEGMNGAVSMMYYENGKRQMELKETIIQNNLPYSLEAFYHHKHMDNIMKYSFTKIDETHTRYSVEVEYTRINWVMPRLIAILFPNMYRKSAQKWMENFKSFLEQY